MDRYIGRQVLMGTLYAVVVLGLVLVLGNLFKKIQPLMVEMKAPPSLVLKFALNILPLSVMYTLPWGFLSAVMLVFGRLSSQQETTSFRVAGVSLPRLAAPVFVLGAMFSVLSMWVNTQVVPRSKYTTNQLLYDQATTNPDSLLKPGVAVGNFGGEEDFEIKVLVEGKKQDWLKGFHLYLFSGGGKEPVTVHADRAEFVVNKEKRQLIFEVQDTVALIDSEQNKIGTTTKAEPVIIDLKKPRQKDSAMTNNELREAIAKLPPGDGKEHVKYQAEISKRYAFSLACFSFAFVAVPLGLNSRRKDNSLGLVYSLAIGVGYFLLTTVAEEFSSVEMSTFMMWLPNVLCILIGLVLFRRARYK